MSKRLLTVTSNTDAGKEVTTEVGNGAVVVNAKPCTVAFTSPSNTGTATANKSAPD